MLKASAETKAGTEAEGLQGHLGKRSDSAKRTGVRSKANESRQDPITGVWTIFAPDREKRPDEFRAPTQNESVKVECPFCAGAESKTPPAVWVGKLSDSLSDQQESGEPAHLIYRDDEIAKLAVNDWHVRVVPNRFPAITPLADSSVQRSDQAGRDPNLFPQRIIGGGHEVIIETPRHVGSLTELDLAEVSLLFAAYRDRIAHWHNTAGIAYISVFKNVGGQAGASLKHCHSQLIASNILPTQVRLIGDRLAKYRARTGCCLQCDLIRAELKAETRVIAKTDSLVAYCPYASPMPMMARLTSIEHLDRFDLLDDRALLSVSRLVRRVISWLESLHPGTSYNMLLHSRPPGIEQGCDYFHWSIDIFPRLARIAGFEFSTDCRINPVMPESAAGLYRDCAAAEDPRLIL